MNGTGYNNDVGNRHLINFMDDKLRQLEERVNRLEQTLEKAKVFEPYIPDNLAQGEDKIRVTVRERENDKVHCFQLNLTWNQLFAQLAPYFVIEATITDDNFGVSPDRTWGGSEYPRSDVYEAFTEFIEDEVDLEKYRLLYKTTIRDIIIQFKALNLLTESTKKHTLKDRNEYWCLTDYGKQFMLKLSTIKREN